MIEAAGDRGLAATTHGPACRFAPSPNGALHLGHAYSALVNQRWARRTGGRMLLRMEDIDLTRCRPAYEAAILDDLAWLGIVVDAQAARQSERFAAYAVVLDELRAAQSIYPCFCSRGEIAQVVAACPDWPRDPDGVPLYPGTCRILPERVRAARLVTGEPAGWRLDMTTALAQAARRLAWLEYGEGDVPQSMGADPSLWGDVLLARKAVPTSYHLAVVVDDAAQGISDILRGDDLRAATSLHRLLQALLGYPAPRYHHHRLMRDDHGRKLSKSAGSPSLHALRDAGVTAGELRARLGFLDS